MGNGSPSTSWFGICTVQLIYHDLSSWTIPEIQELSVKGQPATEVLSGDEVTIIDDLQLIDIDIYIYTHYTAYTVCIYIYSLVLYI